MRRVRSSTLLKAKTAIRYEDCLNLDIEGKYWELFEGKFIVLTPNGWRHSVVLEKIFYLMLEFVTARPEIKALFGSAGFLLERNPDTLIGADASIFRDSGERGSEFFEFAPEVMIEVTFQENPRKEIPRRMAKCLALGVEQFWVVYPEKRTVEVNYAGGRVDCFKSGDVIMGEGLLTGFSVDLKNVFSDLD